MIERFITPQKLVDARLDGVSCPKWDVAVLCFRGLKGSLALVEALQAAPLGRKVLWGMEETPGLPCIYIAELAGRCVGIVTRCLWGGPQAAILVEELAAMGVRVVIGYGAAGSIDPTLCQGTQLAILAALPTDGTSRHYTQEPAYPDPGLLSLLKTPVHVTAATVDAVYRETPALIAEWRELGARAINMEVAPLYATAAQCGVRSLWLGHVSDVLDGAWQDWFVDRAAMNQATVENCLALLSAL